MDRVRVGRSAGNRRVEDDDCFCFMGGEGGTGNEDSEVAIGLVVLEGVHFVRPLFFLESENTMAKSVFEVLEGCRFLTWRGLYARLYLKANLEIRSGFLKNFSSITG